MIYFFEKRTKPYTCIVNDSCRSWQDTLLSRENTYWVIPSPRILKSVKLYFNKNSRCYLKRAFLNKLYVYIHTYIHKVFICLDEHVHQDSVWVLRAQSSSLQFTYILITRSFSKLIYEVVNFNKIQFIIHNQFHNLEIF